jgi:hypothetical protein
MRSSAEAEGITDLPNNLLWLEKPIIVAELTATIDKVLELEQKALDDDSSNNITEEGDSSEETEDEINTEATEKQGFFKRLFGI